MKAMAHVPDGLRAKYAEVYERLIATYAQTVSDSNHTEDTHLQNVAPSHPYFISPPCGYADSKYKVMVVGQETRGWYCHDGYQFMKNNATVDQLLDHHADGFKGPDNFGWGGTFVRGCKLLRERLVRTFDCESSEISLLPNNVLKIGKHKGNGRPSQSVIQWQREAGCMDLLREEICTYYKPTHLVFFTGPHYDQYLDMVFPDLRHARVSEELNDRQKMAVLSCPALEGIKAVRTYHPGYLSRTGRLDVYISAVVRSLT